MIEEFGIILSRLGCGQLSSSSTSSSSSSSSSSSGSSGSSSGSSSSSTDEYLHSYRCPLKYRVHLIHKIIVSLVLVLLYVHKL